jgi:hypothetical protein
MKDNSRALISSAFSPFTGMELDETAMMKESLVQIQVFMKQTEIPKPCAGTNMDDLQVDQNQLVMEISENADKAKNLIIDFKLGASLTK